MLSGEEIWTRMQDAHPGEQVGYDRIVVEILADCCDHEVDGVWEGRGRGTVCLLGPTGVGKSYLLRRFAEAAQVKLITCMIGMDDPTDLGGIPIRVPETLEVTYSNPSLIPAKYLDPAYAGKFMLLLDEIDKAPADVLAVCLDLILQRTIRNQRLNPLCIVCAMNEPQRVLHSALLSRLLVVPFPGRDYDLWGRADLQPLKPFLGGISPMMQATYLPAAQRRTTPGSLHRIAAWLDSDGFWAAGTPDEPNLMMYLVLQGSMSESDAAAAQSRFLEQPTTPSLDWARTATPADVAAGLIYYLFAPDRKSLSHDVLTILMARASADATGEMSGVLDVFTKSRQGFAALEAHPGVDDQDARIAKAQQVIHKTFVKQQKAAQHD